MLELRRDSRVMTGNLGFLSLALKSNLPFGLRGGAGDCARVTAGQKRPNLGLCPGSNVAPDRTDCKATSLHCNDAPPTH